MYTVWLSSPPVHFMPIFRRCRIKAKFYFSKILAVSWTLSLVEMLPLLSSILWKNNMAYRGINTVVIFKGTVPQSYPKGLLNFRLLKRRKSLQTLKCWLWKSLPSALMHEHELMDTLLRSVHWLLVAVLQLLELLQLGQCSGLQWKQQPFK